MLSNYTFLTDHSYSMRPIIDDNGEILTNRHGEKNKRHRRASNRAKMALTENRIASMDRHSSDKENNSIIVSTSSDIRSQAIEVSTNEATASKRARTTKKASIKPRSSTRPSTTNSNIKSEKKHDDKSTSKIDVKSIQRNVIRRKKTTNRTKSNPLRTSQTEVNDLSPSLSIEERVKLRRTTPFLPSTAVAEKVESKKISKPRSSTIKTISSTKSKIIKSKKDSSKRIIKKFFLGSGLDLDNIVPGNRQRRCVKV